MTKVMSETHSAVQRALRATSSSVPRIVSIPIAPINGKKVVMESTGQDSVIG